MAPPRSPSEAEYVIEQRPLRVCDIPLRLRPREEMDRLGVRHVSDDVLLAVILRSGVCGANVVDLSRTLLRTHGTLSALARCSVDELKESVKGIGRVKAQVLSAALELARRLGEEALPKRCRVRTPEDAARLLRDQARTLDTEVFWVLHLDAKNYMKGVPVEVSRGLLDASLVHPREVFRDAIRSATAAAVLVHNHRSGDPSPSAEDLRVTRQLVEAGKIVDIRILDHVILGKAAEAGGPDFLSMRESGIVSFA